MLQKITRSNEKGFTLIELMIVIAIIGILAAVAIPNFIEYRNKAFCTAAISDANSVAAALANHFAIPTKFDLTGFTLPAASKTTTISDPVLNADGTITITVTDNSSKCPQAYKDAVGGWAGDAYTKTMSP